MRVPEAKPLEKTSGDGAPPSTVKLCVTGTAAAKVASPAWEAVRLQVPAETRVSVVALTVHTDVVVEATATGRPELDEADSAGGAVPMAWLPGDAKVMVCEAR